METVPLYFAILTCQKGVADKTNTRVKTSSAFFYSEMNLKNYPKNFLIKK